MQIKVYNTLSRSKEEFVPMSKKEVHMFVCGQTVYDDAHLGHAKTYINFDVVARWLRHQGLKLKYIQSITNVEDKIIARAKERGVRPEELADEYEKRFFEDMTALGVKQNVNEYPRSSDYIDVIREQIQLLADKGYAYGLDGDIYYDVDKFGDYTKLSGMDIEELGRHRVEPREGKRNVYDFALWKAAKEGEPSWKITIKLDGKKLEFVGRPGWHIEDTAMTYKIFGPQYDLHGGASELIFPHHTNEIAQSEAAFSKVPFVKYWLHSGVLNIKGVKMSKSLKNFITIREVLKRYDAETLRLFFCSTHYRKEINYTESLIEGARKQLGYLYSSFSRFYNMGDESGDPKPIEAIMTRLGEGFTNAMDDDFNTPLALSSLVIAINALRSYAEQNKSADKGAKEDAVSKVLEYSRVLGILGHDTYKEPIPDEASGLVSDRERLRKEKKFNEADQIREKLKKDFGITVEDTEYGPAWYRG